METTFQRKLLAVIVLGAVLIGLVASSLGSPSPVKSDQIEVSKCEQFILANGATLYYCPAELSITKIGTPTRTEMALPSLTLTDVPTSTETPTPGDTATATYTQTETLAVTHTSTPSATQTSTATATATPGITITPFSSAPLCLDSGTQHDSTLWHGLWDGQDGCHYDHEHGQNPFTPQVANAFPGFDLRNLLCNVEVGHCNPTSVIEFTHKGGGMKWQVDLNAPNGSQLGFEDADIAVCKYALQFHSFGNYAEEFNTRIHSAVALFQQCKPNSTDFGYVFVSQHVDYGVRAWSYQGAILHYPDDPVPEYDPAFAPYWTTACFGEDVSDQYRTAPCVDTWEQIRSEGRNISTTWTSDPRFLIGSGSKLLTLLLRGRDGYQALDSSDQVHPYTWRWVCSLDSGLTYAPALCRWNNSTIRAHQLEGTIPASWDNVPGFDTDSRNGRITAQGYVTRFGEINSACVEVGTDCHPIKLINAYVGNYGSFLIPLKIPAFGIPALPERDIYFCNGVVCTETSPSSIPSGWLGENN